MRWNLSLMMEVQVPVMDGLILLTISKNRSDKYYLWGGILLFKSTQQWCELDIKNTELVFCIRMISGSWFWSERRNQY